MPREEVVLLGDQLLPSVVGLPGLIAPGLNLELEPALVVFVHRLEETPRIGGMDEDGDSIFRADCPHRVEARVVHFDAALAVAQGGAELLPNLESDRPGFDVGLQLGRRALRVIRGVEI